MEEKEKQLLKIKKLLNVTLKKIPSVKIIKSNNLQEIQTGELKIRQYRNLLAKVTV